MEEPGSKQLLAFEHDRVEDVCRDMIAHLVNDIVVVGARPVAVLDVVVCGSFEKKTMVRIVSALVAACREQECSLVGGETSVQPGVLPAGRYILSATAVGVVERSKIIDRSRVRTGDVLLALASSGPHTNGYSLIRRLLESQPDLAAQRVAGQSFFEAVMAPHMCYYQALRAILGDSGTHGIAHVTGGGIADNVVRIIPPETDAVINLSSIKVPPVFSAIRDAGKVTDEEMLRVFNNGVGIVLAVSPERVRAVESHLGARAVNTYVVGSGTPRNGTGHAYWACQLVLPFVKSSSCSPPLASSVPCADCGRPSAARVLRQRALYVGAGSVEGPADPFVVSELCNSPLRTRDATLAQVPRGRPTRCAMTFQVSP